VTVTVRPFAHAHRWAFDPEASARLSVSLARCSCGDFRCFS